MEEKDYTFKTIEEVVEELLSLPFGYSVDFTFDVPEDEDENFEPTGWHGIKLADLFDEPEGVLCFGMYGGINTRVENIYDTKDIKDIFQKICNEEMGCEVDVLCVSKKHNGN